MTCHNCLCTINEGEPYRKINRWGTKIAVDSVIYIHYPHCPEGADPDAHYQQNVLAGKAEYNFIPEKKYIEEPVIGT